MRVLRSFAAVCLLSAVAVGLQRSGPPFGAGGGRLARPAANGRSAWGGAWAAPEGPPREGTALWAKKGKKKKKGSGKSGSAAGSGGGGGDTSAPRIDRHSGTSMRQQLAMVRARQRFEAAESKGDSIGTTRKFRRSKDDWRPAYDDAPTGGGGTHRGAGTRLLVDGHNVIHAWPKLKKRLNRGEMPLARTMLEGDMDAVAAMKGWDVTVVYDGQGEETEGVQGDTGAIAAVFTGRNETADTFIERQVSYMKALGVPNVLVATDDNGIRNIVSGVGGMYISCGKLLSEVKTAHKEATAHAAKAAPVVPGAFRIQDILSEEERRLLEEAVGGGGPDGGGPDRGGGPGGT